MRFILLWIFIGIAVPCRAVDSEFGYEFWDISFYTPSRMWRLGMREQVEGTVNSFEYLRTSRYGRIDNTFNLGYAGKEPKWSWELKGGYTQKADVMYRKMGELALFMPLPGVGVDSIVRGNYRRYDGAKITTGEAGLRWNPLSRWEVSGLWGKITTAILSEPRSNQSSPSSNYNAGFHWTDGMRVFVFQSAWKEFFDPGNPASPLEYERSERGGGFHWSVDNGVSLMGSYAVERRSNDTSIRKYALTLQQTY